MNAREKEKQEALEHLRSIIKPGDTVYTILLRHVSRSGMIRVIDPLIVYNRTSCAMDARTPAPK